jgi:hypothetical protein
MEEERLLLMREGKEIKDKNRLLQSENDEYRNKIATFEKELEDLQIHINAERK